MKKIILIAFFSFFFLIPTSNAAYYYVTDEGVYMLCGGEQPGCISVVRGQDGVTFDLNDEEIWKDGHGYYFDEAAQEDYYETLYGKTRMFFYQDTNGNYVLCETESSCRTYTFDRLMEMGASITNKSQIEMGNAAGPGEPGDIYYYNRQFEELSNAGALPPDDVTTDGSLATSSEYCGKLKEPLKFIGNIVLVVKILIPLVIIAFGMIDFFRAMIGSKDEEIKKSTRSLLFRCIAGIVIFLLPTLISFIFSLIDSWASIEGEFNACQKCVLNVRECE